MKKLIIILSTIVLLIFSYLAYYGLFSSIKINEGKTGPFILVYEKYEGDYRNTGEIMDRIHASLLNNFGINTKMNFGIFYDNPQVVKTEKLRSISGCIVENQDSLLLKNILPHYKIKKFPFSKCLIAEFPYKGNMSIFVGVLKVYPVLNEHLENLGVSNQPIMEIYDQTNHKILYIAAHNLKPHELELFLE